MPHENQPEKVGAVISNEGGTVKLNGQSSDTPEKETATTGVAKFCKWVWKKADQNMSTWKSPPVPDTNRTSSVLCAGWESWKTGQKKSTPTESFGHLTTKSRVCYQKRARNL